MTNRQVALISAMLWAMALGLLGQRFSLSLDPLENADKFLEWLTR